MGCSDGTFDAAAAVGSASTVSSQVPTGTVGTDDAYTAVAGQAGQNDVVITGAANLAVHLSAASASSSSTSATAQATPLPVVNKLAIGDVASSARQPTSAVNVSASPGTSDVAHHGGHLKCQIVTKTVTVTVTPQATEDIQQRHAARRSRRHALTFP